MEKLIRVKTRAIPVVSNGAHYGYMMFCPGCECAHVYDQRWAFTGTLQRPTLTPSYDSRTTYGDPQRKDRVCHSYVIDGQIKYLLDCTHAFAGQTVDLPDEFEFDELDNDT